MCVLYHLFPVMLTQGLLANERLCKLVKLTSCEISFRSVMLFEANVNVTILVGKKRSH